MLCGLWDFSSQATALKAQSTNHWTTKEFLFFLSLFFFFDLAFEISVPQPGMEPVLPAVET